MDISEIYVKMCDCPEIQGEWTISFGDWFLCKCEEEIAGTDIMVISTQEDVEECEEEGANDIWLPRQDQIQEMMPPHDHPKTIAIYFGLFCDNKEMFTGIYAKEGYGFVDKFHSMEQLWLAFYMSENHQKIWDGEKWVKSVKE